MALPTQIDAPKTRAALSAFKELQRLARFMAFFLNGAKALYELRERQAEAGEVVDAPNWTQHKPFVAELILTRIVDNFLVFVTDLLAQIYRARPEALRTSEQERLDFILKYPDMESLIHALAEKRVDSLSYKSMTDLSQYISDQLGFELFPNGDDLSKAVRLVEMRNVIVHCRGVVSKQAARRCPEFSDRIGQQLGITYEDTDDFVSFLLERTTDIDKRAAHKFGIA